MLCIFNGMNVTAVATLQIGTGLSHYAYFTDNWRKLVPLTIKSFLHNKSIPRTVQCINSVLNTDIHRIIYLIFIKPIFSGF